MVDLDAISPRDVRPLKRAEYEYLVERGWFEDERIELLAGLLVAKEPQSPYHADLLTRLAEELSSRTRGRCRVRVQAPLVVSEDSEPEPDLALVPISDYWHAHPSTALLVIEIARTSGARDRTVKAAIYARGDVREYWVVDIGARCTDVHRSPAGGVWGSVVRVPWTDALSPLAFPDVEVSLETLVRSTARVE